MKRTLKIASLLCLLPMAHSITAQAHSDGYVYDTRFVVVRDSFGNCVRTNRWNPENAIKECDPDLFKQAAPVAAPPAAPKAVVAPAAPAAPVVTKHAPITLSLSADEAFDSNKAELKPAAKRKLSDLALQMGSIEYGQVTIVGHADRTGSKKQNQSLSERRANAAHNYLVSVGVPATKIASSGVSSSQPVTKPGDCAKLKSKKLQACLAPDRRVEVTVTDIHAK